MGILCGRAQVQSREYVVRGRRKAVAVAAGRRRLSGIAAGVAWGHKHGGAARNRRIDRGLERNAEGSAAADAQVQHFNRVGVGRNTGDGAARTIPVMPLLSIKRIIRDEQRLYAGADLDR